MQTNGVLNAYVDPCHNGFRSLDHEGRPAAHAHYFKSTRMIGAELHYPASTKDLDRQKEPDEQPGVEMARQPGTLHRWIIVHSEDPVAIRVNRHNAAQMAYYRRLFADGVLVAADEKTARLMGSLSSKTVETKDEKTGKVTRRTTTFFAKPKEVLAASRARAVAEWTIHYGEDAMPCMLADDPRAGFADGKDLEEFKPKADGDDAAAAPTPAGDGEDKPSAGGDHHDTPAGTPEKA
jgi:hypothetical protein